MISDRLTDVSVAQLCQMQAAMASSRWVIRAYRPSVVRPPCRSRSSWPLRVSLTDSIHCRIQPIDPCRGVSSLPVRPDQVQPVPGGDQVLELASGEPLVPDQRQARPQRAGPGSVGQQFRGSLALPDLGSARHHATGIPSGVVIRYSFSPQYQRECAAQ